MKFQKKIISALILSSFIFSNNLLANSENTINVGNLKINNELHSNNFLNNFNFTKSNNYPLIEILSNNSNIKTNITEFANKTYIDFIDSKVNPELIHNFDVRDFGTVITNVSFNENKNSTRLTINHSEEVSLSVNQLNNKIEINVRPVSSINKAIYNEFGITTERVNFNFENADLRGVLYAFAQFTNMNIVLSDNISGNVSINLRHVPAHEVLDTLLRLNNLDKRVNNNIILIAPAEELIRYERLMAENRKELSSLSPVHTEFIRINYANAEDITNLFNQNNDPENPDSSIRVDGRTNTIIVTDTRTKIDELKKIINEIDQPVRQVMVEARIVITNRSAAEELGVRWNYQELFGSRSNVNSMIDLGANVASSSLSLGYLGADSLFNIELSAMQSEGRAEVISTPKVITLDNHRAMIQSGTQIPYQESAGDGATTTSFQDALLSLEVTPQITPNNSIVLDLNIKQDSVGTIFNGIPSIDKQEIQTKVMVNNGETVVLGGILKEEDIARLEKVPFLSEIPGLGALFRNNISDISQLELLMFVTPRIID